MGDDLPEKAAVGLLYHILQVRHLRVSKFDIYYTLMWEEFDVVCLIDTLLFLFHLSGMPAYREKVSAKEVRLTLARQPRQQSRLTAYLEA